MNNKRINLNEEQATEMFPKMIDALMDAETLLNNVYPIAIKTLDRYEGMKDLVYDPHDGYYVVYKIVIDEDEVCRASAPMTDNLLEKAKLTEKEMRDHAWYNLTYKMEKESTCESMFTILKRNWADMVDDEFSVVEELTDNSNMYVLQVENGKSQMSGILGNFDLLRNTIFNKFPTADKVIVIPSSVYEFILMPIENSKPSPVYNALTSIVKEVNGSTVDPREQVADNAFLLTREELQYI